MKTKDQQAQQYAEKTMEYVYSEEWDSEYVKELIETAYDDGAVEALASQWRSVDEELPEDDSYFYFVADINKNPLAVDCAEYTCETKKFSRGGQILHPTHWMLIAPTWRTILSRMKLSKTTS